MICVGRLYVVFSESLSWGFDPFVKAVGGSKAYTQGLGMRHVVALLKAAGFKVGRWFLKAGEISLRDGVRRGLIAVDGTAVIWIGGVI